MILLGLDTSCDETSAALVEDGRRVLANVVHSQVKVHHPYGGVVPELASREHMRNIVPVVDACLSEAGCDFQDLDGIAVTVGPGLVGALLVGLYYAKGVALANRLPLVAVNHLEGHILSIFLEEDVPFPFLALTVSGGHTSLYHVKGFGNYVQMGQTLDDAAGEAFDKVAKILGLGYPGGVLIDRLAKEGNPETVTFPRAMLGRDSLDFSFSGLKTAVALFVDKWNEDPAVAAGAGLHDILASFQEAVVDVLVEKVRRAREAIGAHSVVVAGGVACNSRLRERLRETFPESEVSLHFPPPRYCTDNGAMIAAAGYHRFRRGEVADLSVDVRSKFPIQETASGMMA